MFVVTRFARAAAFTAALLSAPLLAPLTTPAVAQVGSQVSAEFRQALEPYGEFRTVGRWGEVWIPANVGSDWRPYTVGHWVYSEDYGWYWVSDDTEAQWGWVTFHYGRWIHDRDVGWAWVPGNQWGPAFVDWRRGRNYVGWAPMPPDALTVDVTADPVYWAFVPARQFLSPRVAAVIVPLRDNDRYFHDTVVVNRTVLVRDRGFAVNPGIAPAIIGAAVGHAIRTAQVRPVVLAGTANIAGAITVRTDELRSNRASVVRQATNVQQTNTTIQPTRNVPAPQPLARGETGRLGNNPPRAAQGAAGAASTTGAAPTQQSPPAQATRPGEQRGPNAERRTPSGTTGQAPSTQRLPEQRNLGNERPGHGAQQRERGGAQNLQNAPRTRSGTTGEAPLAQRPSEQRNQGNERPGHGAQQRERGGAQNLQNAPRTPSGTTGEAPSTQRPSEQRNLGNERPGHGAQQRERGGAQNLQNAPRTPSGTTGQAPSTQRPSEQRNLGTERREPAQRPGTTGAAPREPNLNQGPRRESPPAARREGPSVQSPAVRGPAARGPEPRQSAPTAQQRPHAAPATTGAGPRGGAGGRHEEHR